MLRGVIAVAFASTSVAMMAGSASANPGDTSAEVLVIAFPWLIFAAALLVGLALLLVVRLARWRYRRSVLREAAVLRLRALAESDA